MKSDLAIAALIRSRMTELRLSRGEFAKRLGYKNIAKGIRRIDALCEGRINGTKQFLHALPQALETSADTVTRALDHTVREIELAETQEAEVRDQIWRENFRPHAVILTERTVPSPIFVAAIIGIENLLRIDLDATQGPVSFVRQVLNRLPEEVAAFGKPIGFVINYSPDQAIRFDLNGQPTAILDKAVRPGTAVLLRLGRRPIPAEALGVVFSK
jgi:transcriptional regulator with XRE-family HTH domain